MAPFQPVTARFDAVATVCLPVRAITTSAGLRRPDRIYAVLPSTAPR